MDVTVQDFFIYAVRGLVEEGWVAYQHFVAEDATRPPVRCLYVPIGLYNFWRKILWRAAERPRTVVYNLCETEIRQAKISARIQKKIFGFKIAVYYAKGMKISECKDDGGEIEARDVRGKQLVGTELQ
jgi:hypothetical protein